MCQSQANALLNPSIVQAVAEVNVPFHNLLCYFGGFLFKLKIEKKKKI